MTWRTEICTYDMGSGEVTVVHRSDRLLEAPNWHPDEYLIVNGDGLLWRLTLDGVLAQIDTGGLHKLNNDHGPSPDGEWIAISDKTEEGASTIYVLPSGGGTPRRITPNIPSYFHGWGADGETLFYTARRGDTYQVYAIPVAGGEERALTSEFLHCDGPDASPDGQWVWFNGETAAGVDIWRIPPTGGAAERMTDGPSVNWFPHPSPDGAHVLYLAYPPGTQQHPRDLDVELRLMSAGGGPSRKLLSLFGGQGTINVPCWRPDGMAFAFARYAPVS